MVILIGEFERELAHQFSLHAQARLNAIRERVILGCAVEDLVCLAGRVGSSREAECGDLCAGELMERDRVRGNASRRVSRNSSGPDRLFFAGRTTTEKRGNTGEAWKDLRSQDV